MTGHVLICFFMDADALYNRLYGTAEQRETVFVLRAVAFLESVDPLNRTRLKKEDRIRYEDTTDFKTHRNTGRIRNEFKHAYDATPVSKIKTLQEYVVRV
jgi:hypothetical protein